MGENEHPARQSRTRKHMALVALGIALKLLGLAIMIWSLIVLVPTGVGGLLVAIGGFLVVSAGAEIRISAVQQLRLLRRVGP